MSAWRVRAGCAHALLRVVHKCVYVCLCAPQMPVCVRVCVLQKKHSGRRRRVRPNWSPRGTLAPKEHWVPWVCMCRLQCSAPLCEVLVLMRACVCLCVCLHVCLKCVPECVPVCA